MKDRGSEWHRWDLHVHTPSSHDYANKENQDEDIIAEMKKNNVYAFAVTDHHVIDTDRIKRLQKLGNKEEITVLPGIEFLSNTIGKEAVHFIGIFSENSNIDYIWGQIKNKTNIREIEGKGKRPDVVYVDIRETISIIKENGGIVTIHAGSKSNSVENISHKTLHTLSEKIDLIKSIDILEIGKLLKDTEHYKKNVFDIIKKKLPIIMCSDNHNISDYQIKEKLWIKGRLSFEGLKYALNEPEERFFIGEEPEVLKRVRNDSTKYIKSLEIRRKEGADPSNRWFEDVDIPINSELVSIIGNKGSGKSAIADILGLCANSEHSEHFLFLHKDKFKKKGLANNFLGNIIFKSEEKTKDRGLGYEINKTDYSRVRYLPQNYFEKICNEIGKIDDFRKEIEKVVFQYIPKHERMNKYSFGEFITFKKTNIHNEITNIIKELQKKNDQIIVIEKKLCPAFLKELESKKKYVDKEFDTHNKIELKKVEDPDQLLKSPEIIAKREKLSYLAEEQQKIQKKIDDLNRSNQSIEEKTEEILFIYGELLAKRKEINNILINNQSFLDKLGLNLSKITEESLNLNLLVDKADALREENKANITKRDKYSLGLNQNKNQIEEIEKSLNQDQKKYHNYLKEKEELNQKKNDILSRNMKLESQILEIKNDFPEKLKNLREERLELSVSIYKKKEEVRKIYDNIKIGVEERLVLSKVSGLEIVTKIYPESNMKDKILMNISQNKKGSFYGKEDGARLLQESLLSKVDWNSIESIKVFLSNIIKYLEFDKREHKEKQIYIGDIVTEPREFYNYLYSMEFLTPYYDLQQNNKSLEQLSPGEKGALLLVFYLVLDKEDIPLIIDQPEDNLDNKSVAQFLVPFITQAKKRRQIILVTHNPNLAVVSDSDQIIRVSIDKENGNLFNFVSGGIEDKKINREILDVLEGTIPAFTKRRDKYQIT